MQSSSVRAIIDNKKTQTRRLVKGLSPDMPQGKYQYRGVQHGIHALELLDDDGDPTEQFFPCSKPQYFPNEAVYVKEAYGYALVSGGCLYKADYATERMAPPLSTGDKWRSALFMPESLARVFLKITDLRVEYLRDISVEDVLSEGIRTAHGSFANAINREAYFDLFYRINTEVEVKSNPLVWVYSFVRVSKPGCAA